MPQLRTLIMPDRPRVTVAVVALNIFALKIPTKFLLCNSSALERKAPFLTGQFKYLHPQPTYVHIDTPGDLQYRLTEQDKDNDRTKSPMVSQLIPKQEEAADSYN